MKFLKFNTLSEVENKKGFEPNNSDLSEKTYEVTELTVAINKIVSLEENLNDGYIDFSYLTLICGSQYAVEPDYIDVCLSNFEEVA